MGTMGLGALMGANQSFEEFAEAPTGWSGLSEDSKMNDEIIVFGLPNGLIRYSTCPVGSKKNGETKSLCLNRVFHKTIRDHSIHAGAMRINDAKRPDGIAFAPSANKQVRDAWRHMGRGQIVVNPPPACAQRMQETRAERDVKLQAADGSTTRETEQNGLNKAAWIDHKPSLRGIPAKIDLDAMMSSDDLGTFEPVWPIMPVA